MGEEEKEVKIKLDELLFNRIESLVSESSKFLGEKLQKDEYFDNDIFYITNLNRGLRVRWNNNTPRVLEFKSLFYNPKAHLKNNPWYIEEIKMSLPLQKKDVKVLVKILKRLGFRNNPQINEVSDYESLVTFLKKQGLFPVIVVVKKRREYKYLNAILTFDKVKDLGYFLEIESDDPLKVIKKLGIKDFKLLRNGYNDMIAEGMPNFISNDERQKHFQSDIKWNILPSEKKLVEKLLKH